MEISHDTTLDAFLGGRITIEQSRTGYRAAMDSVLLAAAIPDVGARGRVLELGCGVGTALLCYAARVQDALLTGLELDRAATDLASRNAARNGVSERVGFVQGDLLSMPPSIAQGSFDQAFANPPYGRSADEPASPHPDRARSNFEGAARLDDWIAALLRAVKPKGGITVIHRAERVDEILHLLHRKAGDITVIPLWPRTGQQARRVIVRARKAVRGGSILHPGLLLHGPDARRYSDAATAILRDGAPLL